MDFTLLGMISFIESFYLMDLSPLGRIGVIFSALVNTFLPIAMILIVAVVIDDLIGFRLMRKFVGGI